ncbi:MAG TPA: ATP-binding protein, partial [Cyclobacteriaceae bacterium]
RLKILMLEDVEEDSGLIRWSLEKGGINFESKRVDKREAFVDALRNYQPDVVLSDHSLPQFNSMEALRICRMIDLRAPFILVTGTVSEEFAVACLKQGADDYVLKSNLTRLPSAIQNALLQRELRAKQKATELELRLQNDELVKINNELDNFVYSVSHNLRAPLSTVMGLLNLARQQTPDTEEWRQYCDMMASSIQKLDDTLKEILEYSRNARNEIAVEQIDFERLAKVALEMQRYQRGFDHVEKSLKINCDPPFYSDSYRIGVIINNLISNAIRFSDDEKKQNRIELRVERTDPGVRITIEDNGVGIMTDMQKKVFDMFFRGSVKSEGAGLGLYIVREMVSKLRGTINLTSNPGQGTCVTIELPDLAADRQEVVRMRVGG